MTVCPSLRNNRRISLAILSADARARVRVCGANFFLRLILHETGHARARLYRLRIIPLFPRQILHETFIAQLLDRFWSVFRAGGVPSFFSSPSSPLLFRPDAGSPLPAYPRSRYEDAGKDGPRIIRVYPFSGRVGADKKCLKGERWRAFARRERGFLPAASKRRRPAIARSRLGRIARD